IGNLISFFLPLSIIPVQVALLLGAIISLYFNKTFASQFRWLPDKPERIHGVLLISGAVMIILLLQLHSSTIVHPDTLSYHASIIQWIEQCPQVYGIANLESRLGLQSSWYVGSAL